MRRIIVLLEAVFLVFFAFKFFPQAIAQYLSSFDATVKISVCGDEIIEGEEDCEGDDLNSETCESLGYPGGILDCDIACSFDTTSCLPKPTPTPTITPTLTLTPTPTTVPASSSSFRLSTTTTSSSGITNTPTPTIYLSPTPSLPGFISLFDFNQTGHIEGSETYAAVQKWIESWVNVFNNYGEMKIPGEKADCDVDNNRRCDLLDLSVLLYYIGK